MTQQLTRLQLIQMQTQATLTGKVASGVAYSRVLRAVLVIDDDTGRHEIELPPHGGTVLIESKPSDAVTPGIHQFEVADA